jgi:methylated-DNA-[protein]-cysteine S-methyltransferase
MTTYSSFIFKSPVGFLEVILENNHIKQIKLVPQTVKNTPIIPPKTPFAKKVSSQLQRYFKNPKTKFLLPLMLYGTAFQLKVWYALSFIPTGKVVTYGQLAKLLKSSARAVGNACRHNPVPIIIPCHRVVGDKDLGGYCGKTNGHLMDVKRFLLDHEEGA